MNKNTRGAIWNFILLLVMCSVMYRFYDYTIIYSKWWYIGVVINAFWGFRIIRRLETCVNTEDIHYVVNIDTDKTQDIKINITKTKKDQ